MKLLYLFVLLIINFSSLAQVLNKEKYNISFEISNTAFNTVEGSISGMTGKVVFNESALDASSFSVCLDVSTLTTGNKKRDEHLQNEDWFYTEKYPEICFRSKSLLKTKGGFMAVGELTMHGNSKDVEIPFVLENQKLKGALTLERQAYGVGGNSFLVGDEVKIQMDFNLDK